MDFRTEYPRPDAIREAYLCLNGVWEFEIDNERVGIEKKYYERTSLSEKINVPFCPESRLSGLAHTDFMNAVWYRRTFTLPESFLGKRVLLHFGAVDNEATVYLNAKKIGTHKGGYTPFTLEITEEVRPGENVLTVYAEDDVRSEKYPVGKQSQKLNSYGCFYTRTTGIWQTVWMEAVPAGYVKRFFADTSLSPAVLTLRVSTDGAIGQVLTVRTSYEGKPTGEASVTVGAATCVISIPLTETHPWEVGKGGLYDMTLTLSGGDSVRSYFGLREVSWDRDGIRINGKTVFGRFILDQSFFPDGVYTAPTDERLRADILDSMAMGFNGARMHEKVFEPRYLYYADLYGYMIWGEYPNWGQDIRAYEAIENFLPGWREAMERDYNHPALIGWCPFNETWDNSDGSRQCDGILRTVYDFTKAMDGARPCIDTSGNFHVVTDIYDIHDYEQDPAIFKKHITPNADGKMPSEEYPGKPWFTARQTYDERQALFISEYGGIKWVGREDRNAWGIRQERGERRRILRPSARADGRPARQSPHLCFLLHATDGRRTGTERPSDLRPPLQVPAREDPRDRSEKSRDRRVKTAGQNRKAWLQGAGHRDFFTK